MLKINPSPTFEFVAQITVPGQDALGSLRLVGKHKGRSDITRWMESASGGADATFLMGALGGWFDVQGDDGAQVMFSESALDCLLDKYPASGKEIFEQYLNALVESRRKNS